MDPSKLKSLEAQTKRIEDLGQQIMTLDREIGERSRELNGAINSALKTLSGIASLSSDTKVRDAGKAADIQLWDVPSTSTLSNAQRKAKDVEKLLGGLPHAQSAVLKEAVDGVKDAVTRAAKYVTGEIIPNQNTLSKLRDELNQLVTKHRTEVDGLVRDGHITDQKQVSALHGSGSSRGRASIFGELERVNPNEGDYGAKAFVEKLEKGQARQASFAKNAPNAPKTAAADGKLTAHSTTAEQGTARASIQYGGYGSKDLTSITVAVTPDFHVDKNTTSHAASDKEWQTEQQRSPSSRNTRDASSGGKPLQGEYDWNHYSGQKTTQGGVVERTSDFRNTSTLDYDVLRVRALPLRELNTLPKRYREEVLKGRDTDWFRSQLRDMTEEEARGAGPDIVSLWRKEQDKYEKELRAWQAGGPEPMHGTTRRAREAQEKIRQQMRKKGEGLDYGRYSPEARRTAGRDIGDVRVQMARIDVHVAQGKITKEEGERRKAALTEKLHEVRQLAHHGETAYGHEVRTAVSVLNTSFHPTGHGEGVAEFSVALSGSKLQRPKAESSSAHTNAATVVAQTRGGEITKAHGVYDTMLIATLTMRTNGIPGTAHAKGAAEAGRAGVSSYGRSMRGSLSFDASLAGEVAARTSGRAEALSRELYAKLHTDEDLGRGKNELNRHAVGRDPLASFGAVRAKKKGEGLANDVARRREMQKAENKLLSGLARLDGAATEARPLVSKQAQQLEGALGRLDAQIAALKGLRGEALANGSRAVGQTLGEMASIARGMGYQSSGTLKALQARINARREELARLASGLSPEGRASVDDHKRLDQLGRQVPGLEKVVGERHPEKKGRRKSVREEEGRESEHDEHHGRGGKGGKRPQGGGSGKHALHHDDSHDDHRQLGGGKKNKKKPTALAQLGGPRGQKKQALSQAQQTYSRKGSRGLVDLVAPGASHALAELPKKVTSIFEELRRKGNQPRARGWGISLPKLSLPKIPSLADIKKSVTSVVTHSPLAQAVSAATSKVTTIAHAVTHAVSHSPLAQAVNAAKNKVSNIAHAVARNATSAVKKTAQALGSGMRHVTSQIAHAAHSAWDATKHGLKATGNFVAHQYQHAKSAVVSAAQSTGNALKGAWNTATGVVGALGGKIKKGISHIAPYVAQGAKSLGGFLLKTNPLLGGMYQLAKKYGPNIKSMAATAWGGIKSAAKATAGFLQSPAGQLLTTGLSIAATFIPGGILVKAGVGAIMGAIEAVGKGGGLKEALIGAALGGVEGAVPFLKVGLIGKIGVGAIKGGLQTAASGDFSLGGLAKGALGGVFDVAGGDLLKKFGGGKAVKMADKFFSGATRHTGVLGRLQKVASKGGLQRLYGGVKKFAPKVVDGAIWAYDKSGKLHKVLDKAHTVGEGLKGGLEAVNSGADWLAEHTGNERLKGVLKHVGDLSEKGAQGLENPLEYVKKVDGYVSTAHEYLGQGLRFVGVKDPDKAVADMRKRQQAQRRGDANAQPASRLDRVDNWFHNRLHKPPDPSKKKKTPFVQAQLARVQSTLEKSEKGKKLLAAGKKAVDIGVAAKGHIHALHEVVEKGVEAGKSIQTGLQNLAMMTEGVEEDQFGGGALKWLNHTATEWNEKLESGLGVAEKINKGLGLGDTALSKALKAGGVKHARLEASDKKAAIWWGLEKAEEEEEEGGKKAKGKKGEKPGEGAPEGALLQGGHGEGHAEAGAEGEKKPKTVGGLPWKKHEKDEHVVAPWVKWGEKAGAKIDEKKQHLLGEKGKPTQLKKGLDQLEKWRKKANKAVSLVGKHEEQLGELIDKNEALKARFGRAKAGLRLLGGDAGDHEEEWKAYEERRKKAGGEGKEAAHEAKAEKTSEAKATQGQAGHAQAITDPGHGTHQGGGKKQGGSGKQVQKEISDLVGQHTEKLAEQHAKEVEKDEAKAKAAQEADRKENPADHDELPLEMPPLDGKKADDELPLEMPPLDGKKAGADDELPIPGLEEMADAEGVAGGKKLAQPGLPGALADNPFDIGLDDPAMTGQLGQGAAAPGPESDPIFGRLNELIAAYESRLMSGLPMLEAQIAQGPEVGEELFRTLLDEAQLPEAEISRLEGIVGADPVLSKGLQKLAAKLSSLRSGVQMALHKGIYQNRKKDEEGEAAPGAQEAADPSAGGEEQTLVEAQSSEGAEGGEAPAQAQTDPKGAPTAGKAVPGAAQADDSYLGEAHEDTWIGSGAAARPIADGLANNFKFPDQDVSGASIGGELAKLGGALSGLGGSLAGAAGDVGGIFEEVGKGAKAIGGMGAEVGELVGHKDNAVTRGAAKLGGFADWVKKGAGDFEKDAKRLGQFGDKVHEFGGRWQKSGFQKAAGHELGKLFRKGKPGSKDAQSAPAVDAGSYADAPKRLDFSVMSQMERFIGGRFGDVKIHTGIGAEAITRRFDAEAVTIREHIFFAPGRYNPHSTDGRKLLAHELTHVNQRGRPNLDTRTAEEEAHKAEAMFGAPGMEILDLRQPEADFQVNTAGAEHGPAGVRTAKRTRSVNSGSGSHDEMIDGEDLLDLVGERVYELMVEDLEKEHESR